MGTGGTTAPHAGRSDVGRPEGRVENYLRRRVKEEHGKIRKVRWLCRGGAPDNFVWWPGPRAAFIECKAPGEKVNSKDPQAREIARLRADGWTVYVVDSEGAVEIAIREIKDSAGG